MKTLVFKNDEVIRFEGNCQFPDCSKEAIAIAHDRVRNVVEFYCEAHAEQVAEIYRRDDKKGKQNSHCIENKSQGSEILLFVFGIVR